MATYRLSTTADYQTVFDANSHFGGGSTDGSPLKGFVGSHTGADAKVQITFMDGTVLTDLIFRDGGDIPYVTQDSHLKRGIRKVEVKRADSTNGTFYFVPWRF